MCAHDQCSLSDHSKSRSSIYGAYTCPCFKYQYKLELVLPVLTDAHSVHPETGKMIQMVGGIYYCVRLCDLWVS